MSSVVLISSFLHPFYSSGQDLIWEKPIIVGHVLTEYFRDLKGNHYTVGRNYPDEAASYHDVEFPETSNRGGFLVKADSNHVFSWDESFYNIDWSHSPNIAIDQDDNLYIAFSFGGTLKFNAILFEQEPEEHKIVFMKFDSDRNLVWVNQIRPIDPRNYTLVNYKLKIGPSGNIFLLGNSGGEYGFYDKDNKLQYLSENFETAFIGKYSSDGQIIWVKSLPESGPMNQTLVYDIDFDTSENIYFTGTNYNEGTFQGITHMSPHPQIMVGSLSTEGDLNWIRFLGDQKGLIGPNIGYGIAIDNKLEAIYVTGSLRSIFTDEGNIDGKTAILVRMNYRGDIVWHRRMGSSIGGASFGPTGSAVAIDKNGDPIVAGLFWNKGDFGNIELQSPQNPEWGNINLAIFVTKLNSLGDFIWADFAGSYSDDAVKGISIHKPGELLLYGNTRRGAVFGEHRISMDASIDLGFLSTLRYSDTKFLAVNSNLFDFESGVEADSVFEISSNLNWTITSDQDWLIPGKKEGSGNSLIYFKVKENVGHTSRNASITIRWTAGNEKKIRVFQGKGTDLITSIPKGESRDFNIFPNPVIADYNIRLPIPAETLTLYNSEGKKISDLIPSTSNHDASNLSSGMYYLIAVFKDGVEVKKLYKR